MRFLLGMTGKCVIFTGTRRVTANTIRNAGSRPALCLLSDLMRREMPYSGFDQTGHTHVLAETGLLQATARGLSEMMMMPCMLPASSAMGCHQSGIASQGPPLWRLLSQYS